MAVPQTSPRDRPFREVPNPQILDAADQFRRGYRELISMAPGTGVLLPAMHCACICIELYLKCLSAKEIEVDDEMGLGTYYIHPKAAAKSHRFARLFDETPADCQSSLAAAASTHHRLRSYGTLRAALDVIDGLFMDTRYSFEAGANISKVPLDVLTDIVASMSDGVRAVTPRFERT